MFWVSGSALIELEEEEMTELEEATNVTKVGEFTSAW